MEDEIKITDQLLIEELSKRIINYKNALKELNELTHELKEVNEKLSESESLKSHFISNITNEIINPFASILGLSRNIMQSDEKNTAQIKRMAYLIFTEAFSLDFQLKNIFAAAEIEAGQLLPQISNVDICNAIYGVVENFQHEIDKFKIKLTIENEDHCCGKESFTFKTDSEKITIILNNLISNAIKFNRENGEIIIRVNKTENYLNIHVIDTGIGISGADQRKIFDRFYRVDSGINSINRGHGLGLSINKAFIELLGGTIEVRSETGKGAEFIIKVPEAEVEIDDYSGNGSEIFFGGDEKF